MAPFWILLELRMMEMMVTTGAKDMQTYSQLVTNVTANQCQTFTGWMSFLSPIR